jgi:maltose/moltooligosaccharide transporter
MGVYMGIFNFFIVIPEIIASFAFGPIIRLVFGPDSLTAPLFVVMAGGSFLIIASLACLVLVQDVGDLDVPEAAVLKGDQEELFTIPESAQPVPSTGLVDDSEPVRGK